MTLDAKSIDRAIKEIQKYKAWFLRKTTELTERMALIGTREASQRFGAAIYDGVNDVQLTVSPIDNGWMITASGAAVCFIEFGAGVYHNTSEPYPNPRPAGVVPIGEYGDGKGKRQGWMFYSDSGELVFTRGNPAAMPMYYATETMKQEMTRIAREVFSSD